MVAVTRGLAAPVPVRRDCPSIAFVLRSIATALGSIGRPGATSALPLLRDLANIPRVRWAVEAAIRKIESVL